MEPNRAVASALQLALIQTGLDAICSDASPLNLVAEAPPPVDALVVDGEAIGLGDVSGPMPSATSLTPAPVIGYRVRKTGPRLQLQVIHSMGSLEPPLGLRPFCRYVRNALRPPLKLPEDGRIDIGPLKIDTAAYRVHIENEEILLTALEFRLLLVVLHAEGRLLSREVLLEQVWGIRRRVDTRTVDTHMKRLRQKLGRAASLLETVRGFGYRSAVP